MKIGITILAIIFISSAIYINIAEADPKIDIGEPTIIETELTDIEIDEIRASVGFTADEDKVYKTIIKDKKKVKFYINEISPEEVTQILINIMLKLGDTKENLAMELKEKGHINFDEKIEKLSKEKLK